MTERTQIVIVRNTSDILSDDVSYYVAMNEEEVRRIYAEVLRTRVKENGWYADKQVFEDYYADLREQLEQKTLGDFYGLTEEQVGELPEALKAKAELAMKQLQTRQHNITFNYANDLQVLQWVQDILTSDEPHKLTYLSPVYKKQRYVVESCVQVHNDTLPPGCGMIKAVFASELVQ